jgi:hypothetical protein
MENSGGKRAGRHSRDAPPKKRRQREEISGYPSYLDDDFDAMGQDFGDGGDGEDRDWSLHPSSSASGSSHPDGGHSAMFDVEYSQLGLHEGLQMSYTSPPSVPQEVPRCELGQYQQPLQEYAYPNWYQQNGQGYVDMSWQDGRLRADHYQDEGYAEMMEQVTEETQQISMSPKAPLDGATGGFPPPDDGTYDDYRSVAAQPGYDIMTTLSMGLWNTC